jgi:multiple sugar transport system substrate-binding protein
MIKTFSCLVAITLLISACGDAGKGTAEHPTLTFWHFWSEPGQRDALRELLKDFEAKHSCTVQTTELSWNDGKAKLMAAFSASTAPDVLELGSDWVAQFSSAGVLAPLPLDSVNVARFLPFSTAPGMWEGAMYAYPWSVDTRVLYLNAAHFQSVGRASPPETIDDLLSVCQRLAEKGHRAFGANGADANRLYKKILPFMWTLGGDVFDANGKPVLNSAANVAALELYAKLARTGFIETQRELDAAFVQGKVSVLNSGSWLQAKLDASPVTYLAVPFPGTVASPGVSFAGGEYLAVTTQSPRQTLARQLVHFLSGPQQALRFCKAVPEAGFPADRQTFADSALIANPVKAVFAGQLQHARMTPVHPRWLDVQAVLEDAVVNVLYGRLSAQAALDAAQVAVLDILR